MRYSMVPLLGDLKPVNRSCSNLACMFGTTLQTRSPDIRNKLKGFLVTPAQRFSSPTRLSPAHCHRGSHIHRTVEHPELPTPCWPSPLPCLHYYSKQAQ